MTQAAENNVPPKRRGKSEAAFRTISEVAADLDVPQHVLRFWETRFVQIKPMKRGGGRRYYRPEDVELLRRIRALLYEDGYTIKGVQKLLKQNGLRQAPPEGEGAGDPSAEPAKAEASVHSEGGDPASGSMGNSAATEADGGPVSGLSAGQRQELSELVVELEELSLKLRRAGT